MEKRKNVLDEIITKNSVYLKNKIEEYKDNPFLNDVDRKTSILLELVQLIDNYIQNAPKVERKYLTTNFRKSIHSSLFKKLSIEDYIQLLEDINVLLLEG